ncbi:hypothetical protein ACR6C2_38790 [Streptomyces sp. INA 01156]
MEPIKVDNDEQIAPAAEAASTARTGRAQWARRVWPGGTAPTM